MVVDLEATSTGSKAKIIQVGIVVIENGEIVDQYATDVNPHEPLDSHIKELTGLTDKRLAKAPEFSQVAGKVLNWSKTVFLLRTMFSLMPIYWQNFSSLKVMNCARLVSIRLSWLKYFILSLRSIILVFFAKSWGFHLSKLIQPYLTPKQLQELFSLYETKDVSTSKRFVWSAY